MAKDPMELVGFDELQKAFEKAEKKTDDKTKALLKSAGQKAVKYAKAKTPKAKKTTVLSGDRKIGDLRRNTKLKAKGRYLRGKNKSVKIKWGKAYGIPLSFGFHHPRATDLKINGNEMMQDTRKMIDSTLTPNVKRMVDEIIKEF